MTSKSKPKPATKPSAKAVRTPAAPRRIVAFVLTDGRVVAAHPDAAPKGARPATTREAAIAGIVVSPAQASAPSSVTANPKD